MFQIVKSIIASRDPSNVLCVSFDKWTTTDGVKFLGIYLYIEKQEVCLGMIYYTGLCGTEELCTLFKKHLQLYGILPSDITICVVDCGAYVQAVANVFNWFSFPCLAHFVNLLDMLLRFIEMKDVIVFNTDDWLSNYNWEKSKKICSLLKLLKECALELQKSDAVPGVAIKVIRFLNHVERNEAAMTSSVRSVLSKWIDGKSIDM